MRQQVDVLEVKTLDVKAPILARTLGSKPQVVQRDGGDGRQAWAVVGRALQRAHRSHARCSPIALTISSINTHTPCSRGGGG